MSELNDGMDRSEGPGRLRLENQLREVDERFRREMRARGFDPGQGDHLALTAPLAKLYTEREKLRDELEALTEGGDGE